MIINYIKSIINSISTYIYSLNMVAGDWGTWIGSIGTVGAFAFAFWQLKITKKQHQEEKFENILFNLLSYTNEIINSISYDNNGKIIQGREYFKFAYGKLKFYYNDILDKNKNKYNDIEFNLRQLIIINCAYKKFYGFHEDHIGHYFRNLYHVLKFINRSKFLNNNTKKYYASLIRAQLSTYEFLLLFYNSITEYGHEKFLPLIKKYNFLKNINEKKLLNTNHKKIFNNFNKYYNDLKNF